MRLPRFAIIAMSSLLLVPAAHAAAPAQIGSVDCEQGGVVVKLRNPDVKPMPFTMQRDGAVIDKVLVSPATTVERVIPLKEGQSSQITVRFRSSYTSAVMQRSCNARTPAATRAGDAPFPSAAVAPSGRQAGERSALETKTDVRARTANVTIDESPRWPLIALVIAALLALAAGGAALLRQRGRRVGPAAAEGAPGGETLEAGASKTPVA